MLLLLHVALNDPPITTALEIMKGDFGAATLAVGFVGFWHRLDGGFEFRHFVGEKLALVSLEREVEQCAELGFSDEVFDGFECGGLCVHFVVLVFFSSRPWWLRSGDTLSRS